MDLKRIDEIQKLAHLMICEIEFFSIGSRDGPVKYVKPKGAHLRAFHTNLDALTLTLKSGGSGWTSDSGHQENELEAIGVVNQVIAMTLSLPASVDVRTKFKRFDHLFCRARADEWVPSMEDQLKRGAKPRPLSERN
jgi:hypothetical protein